jgi:colicin import membrane protein
MARGVAAPFTAVLHPTGLRPRQAPGSLRAAALAIGAHALLIGALSLGLKWKISSPETPVAAEIWAAVPQIAAPAPVQPPPAEPRVVPPPEPKPVPVPVPKPVPRQAEPDARDAQIAIEKAKRDKKAAQEREAELQREKKALEAQRLEEQRQADLKKAEKLKAEKERAEKEKEREKAAQAKKDQAARDAKAAEDNLAKQREANLARIRGLAGAEGGAAAKGNAQKDAASVAAYQGRIKARIKPTIVLTTDVDGNPIAEVEVRCSPDGTITGRRITKPSGDKVWDDTVLRAIDRTEMLPRDTDGRVPPVMLLVFPRRD